MRRALAIAAIATTLACASAPPTPYARCTTIPGKEGKQAQFYPNNILRTCFPEDKLRIEKGFVSSMLSFIPGEEPYILMDTFLRHLAPEDLAPLIAHEVGHYRLGHRPLQTDERGYLRQELEADRFAAHSFPLGACRVLAAQNKAKEIYGGVESHPSIEKRERKLERLCAQQQKLQN